MKPLPQLNKLIKCFNKINKNVGVNRIPVRTRQSGRARLGGGGGGGGGRYTLVVSEPRFSRLWKKALNDFEKDFENGI